MPEVMPRYPVYVPSKGRYESGFTLDLLARDEVPHFVVVEEHEVEPYSRKWPGAKVLVLPWRDLGTGGLIAVRNWIRDHSEAQGDVRHWQLDDNIERMCYWYRGKRLTCRAGAALRICEDFVDRYEKVAIAGLNYDCFARSAMPPFQVNCHVYSCSLILNAMPFRWRLHYNDDVDICLQAISAGWYTILLNAFLADKRQTMKLRGGNTEIYQGDGRLTMARSLERVWPGVVTVSRRFKRPQHVVNWRKFRKPLVRRKDVDWEPLKQPNDYGLVLRAVGDIESPRLRRMVDEFATRLSSASRRE